MFFTNNKKIFLKKLIIFILIVGFCFVNFTLTTRANGLADIKAGLQETAKTIGLGTVPAQPVDIVGGILNMILGLLGVIFLTMLVIGGYMWVTAHGSEEKVQKAQKLIMHSTIGVIITMASFLISYFVIHFLLTATKLNNG